eukprot:1927598-Ditylum_brightwellii.AAC.1
MALTAYGKDNSHSVTSVNLFTLIEEQNWEKTITHLKDNPSDANVWSYPKGDEGNKAQYRLPIHEACRNSPPKDVIMALIDASPGGVKSRDSNGRLPIHHACIWGASHDVIRILISSFPDSIDSKDKWGSTPIDALEATDHPVKDLLDFVDKENATMEARTENNAGRELQLTSENANTKISNSVLSARSFEKRDLPEKSSSGALLPSPMTSPQRVTSRFSLTESKRTNPTPRQMTGRFSIDGNRKPNATPPPKPG